MGSSVRVLDVDIVVHADVGLDKVQLPSYNFTKTQLVKNNILPANSPWTFLASSSVSGACVVRKISAPSTYYYSLCILDSVS